MLYDITRLLCDVFVKHTITLVVELTVLLPANDLYELRIHLQYGCYGSGWCYENGIGILGLAAQQGAVREALSQGSSTSSAYSPREQETYGMIVE